MRYLLQKVVKETQRYGPNRKALRGEKFWLTDG